MEKHVISDGLEDLSKEELILKLRTFVTNFNEIWHDRNVLRNRYKSLPVSRGKARSRVR